MHWWDFPLGVELMMLVHMCALFSVPLEVQELTFFHHLLRSSKHELVFSLPFKVLIMHGAIAKLSTNLGNLEF